MNVIDCAGPRPRSAPPASKLALLAFTAPFIALPIFLLAVALTSPLLPARPTPAQAEEQELACALLPQALALFTTFIALHRLSRTDPLRNKILTILGLLLTIAFSGLLFFLIVLSHSWLD